MNQRVIATKSFGILIRQDDGNPNRNDIVGYQNDDWAIPTLGQQAV